METRTGCGNCNGVGTIRVADSAGDMDDETCPACVGTGTIMETVDPEADGQPSELKAVEEPKDLPPWEAELDEQFQTEVTITSVDGQAPDIFSDTPIKEISKTALNLDQWDMARGEKVLEDFKDSDAVKDLLAVDWEDKEVPVHVMADLHGAAYLGEPELHEESVDKRRHEFIETLLSSSDFQAMRTSTVLNGLTSELAAIESGKQYVKLVQEDEAREKARGKRPEPKSKKEKEKQDEKDKMEDDSALNNAVNQAVQQADNAVQEFDDMMRGLGHGDSGDGKLDVKKVKNLFSKVRNSRYLKRICELAGRYRRVAQGKQRSRSIHGQDETVDVKFGNDLTRVLPHELSLLGDEDLELEVLRKYTESELMVRETKSIEKLGKGPIIVCVDESGSMDGEPIVNAKAFCLAMAWIAKKQNRPCLLVGYSGGREGTSTLLLPGKPWDAVSPGQMGLCDWLDHFYAGGTDMDVPLEVVPTHWPAWVQAGMTKGKTDMIILTDGLCSIPEAMKNKYLKFKKDEQVRCITMIVGVKEAGPLGSVSDEVHFINTISTEDVGIQSVMSI